MSSCSHTHFWPHAVEMGNKKNALIDWCADLFELIDNALCERVFWADSNEIDLVRLAPLNHLTKKRRIYKYSISRDHESRYHLWHIGRCDRRDTFCNIADTRISWNAVQLSKKGRLLQLPAQRMFCAVQSMSANAWAKQRSRARI
jgi:hypothetical protein